MNATRRFATRPSDLKRVNADRTVFKIVKRLSRCVLLWLSPLTTRRHQPTPLSYIVGKVCPPDIFWLSDPLDALSTSGHAFDIPIPLRRQDKQRTIPTPRFASTPHDSVSRTLRDSPPLVLKEQDSTVNLTHFAGGGQLALESGSERESDA
ncbi:hypothetical protein EV122DRAFT_278682 [Schizophyllum commune]